MSFLPIVERELRVAARKASTYRARSWFVVATSAVAALLLLVGEFAAGARIGNAVFSTLTMLAFVYCLAAGPRYAADCLSEEKREGTLGLLFLTDLRGYDVVFGKLVSTSTQTVQGLLAFFPVLSVALLVGGVTAGEFWRASGVLLNALFVSLSLGLLVSAVSRESHRALAAAVVAVLMVTLVPLGADALLSKTHGLKSAAVAAISPAAALRAAVDLVYRVEPSRFWIGLGLSHALGWSCLVLGSLALPNSWQERVSRPRRQSRQELSVELGSAERTIRLRRRLLDINPIYWLSSRQEKQRQFLWLFVGAVVAAATLIFGLGWIFGGPTLGVGPLLTFGLGLVLKLWVAWRSCSTLAEARRNGAVELLVVTPLSVDEIIRGHWQGLQRFFFWPVIAALGLQVLPGLDALARQPPSQSYLLFFPVPAAIVLGMATLALDLLAAAWVGMWMGLSQPKTMQAFGKTVFFTVVVPWFVFCLPNVVLDLFWISWARRKLQHEFRRAATERYAPSPAAHPQAERRIGPLAAPPVIVETAPSTETMRSL